MKITPTALTINQLFSAANEQFVIPAYQRRYSWRKPQIDDLIQDIDSTEDTDTHLLGSIVCLTGAHTAGLNQMELVDGQQRLTTVTILLECIRQRLQEAEQADLAAELGRMLAAKVPGGKALRKVQLDSLDAEEFEKLLQLKGKHALDETFQNPHLAHAFDFIRAYIAELTDAQVERFVYKLQNLALIIRLDVNDAKDAFKLFETINNRGLKLSPTDIIKNFVLGNAARFGSVELKGARQEWARLVSYLDGVDSDAFFRYFLITQLKQRITKSEVVVEFKWLFMNEVIEAANLPDRHLYAEDEDDYDEDDGEPVPHEVAQAEILEREGNATISFEDFLIRLVACAKAFGEIVLIGTGDKRIDRHLRNLKMIKAAQTYGLLMHLRVGGLDTKRFVEVLKLTESFVLRRHVCKERANETETLFARLCSVNPKDPLVDIKAAYREACPSDDRFREDFAAATYTANIIDRARYCLEKIEIHHHGEYEEIQVLGTDAVEVEHIIPQKIHTKSAKKEFGDWVEYLGERAEAQHPKYVSRIGNLTIFAGELNKGASNNPFIRKRPAYKASAIKMTQEIAAMNAFKFSHVEKRSAQLAAIAVQLWPMP